MKQNQTKHVYFSFFKHWKWRRNQDRKFILCTGVWTRWVQTQLGVKQVVFVILAINHTFFGTLRRHITEAILVGRSRAKIPRGKPNEPAMPPKRTKKVWLGIYRTQIWPSWHYIVPIQVYSRHTLYRHNIWSNQGLLAIFRKLFPLWTKGAKLW